MNKPSPTPAAPKPISTPGPYGPDVPNYARLNADLAAAARKVPRRKIKIPVAAAVALALFVSILISGCAQTAPGLQREVSLYQSSTNGLAWVTSNLVPLVPTPYNGLVTIATGLCGSLLAAWNLSQHRRINALEASQTETATLNKAAVAQVAANLVNKS